MFLLGLDGILYLLLPLLHLDGVVVFDVDDAIAVRIVQRFVQLEHGTERKEGNAMK